MLLIDASVAIGVSLTRDGFGRIAALELVAPPLMWSEAISTLREHARVLGCRLLTRDERLRRGAARLVEVIGPVELEERDR